MFRSSGDRASISMRARNFGSDEENDARRETSVIRWEFLFDYQPRDHDCKCFSSRRHSKTDLNFLIAVHKSRVTFARFLRKVENQRGKLVNVKTCRKTKDVRSLCLQCSRSFEPQYACFDFDKKKKKRRLCLFYIFLAKICRYHLSVMKKKEIMSDVNETDKEIDRLESVSLP